MTVYLVFIFLCMLLWILTGQKNNKTMLVCTSILSCLMMGLRSTSIGSDTERYCKGFLSYSYIPWNDVFNANRDFGKQNYGFYFFNKCLNVIFSSNVTLYLLCVALVITVAVAIYLKKFSTNYFMSTLMLLSLGFTFFFMTGIKQTLALAFVMMAYIALRENKNLKFALFVCVAALFHNTALVVFLAWPIYKLKIRKMYAVIIPVLLGVTFAFQNQIAQFLQSLVSDGAYGAYGDTYVSNNNLTGLAIQCVILVTFLVLSWKSIKEDEDLRFFLSVYSIGIFFQALTPVIAEFFRISMYFSIIGVVMLPYALTKSDFKGKRFLRTGINCVFFLYFILANMGNAAMVPYHFFWYHG